MSVTLLQLTIVIAGAGFSPNNLDPISLAERNVVPQEWEWVVAGNVVTPVTSVVNYVNGISIVNERNKFQISDPGVTDLRSSKAVEIAKNYVSKFTQIGYAAVGINFHAIVLMDSAGKFLADRFLKEDVLSATSTKLQQVGLRLVYSIKGGVLSINVDEGNAEKTVSGEKQSWDGLLFVANHHRDCTERPASKQVIEFLNQTENDWASLEALIGSLTNI